MASTLNVKGMTCQHCVMSVKKSLGKLEGIQNVDVFEELDIPQPDYNLGIAGGHHGEMTGQMLAAIERVLEGEARLGSSVWRHEFDPRWRAFRYQAPHSYCAR